MRDDIEVMRQVSGLLDAAGVDYMLTGSMAMNFHAKPRMTRDVRNLLAGDCDLLYLKQTAQAIGVADLLEELLESRE